MLSRGAYLPARVFYLIASCGRALTSDFRGYAQEYGRSLGPVEIAKAGQYPTMASVLVAHHRTCPGHHDPGDYRRVHLQDHGAVMKKTFYILSHALGKADAGKFPFKLGGTEYADGEKVQNAGKYDTVSEAINGAKKAPFNYDIVRVEEVLGTTTPARENRKVISEREVCSSNSVKWALVTADLDFFYAGRPSGTSDIAEAVLFNSIHEASAQLAPWVKSRGGRLYLSDACVVIVPVEITSIPASTTPSTFTTTVLS